MTPSVALIDGRWTLTFIRAGETTPVTIPAPDMATAERRANYVAGKQKRRAL